MAKKNSQQQSGGSGKSIIKRGRHTPSPRPAQSKPTQSNDVKPKK
jgi:hypothetical protein